MSITTSITYNGSTFASSTAFTVTTVSTGFNISEGGGVTDHGALTGLSDDDHPQYLNNARGDARYPSITNYTADLIAINTELDGKFNTPTGDTTQYLAGDGSLVAFPVAGQAGTLVRQIRNETGSTITKGTVVYISGASGNKATVSKAIATSDSTSAQTFGLVQADIPNNQNGYVVVRGDLIGLDTSAFVDGTQLYLSGSVAGAVTAAKPVAPLHMVYVGVVTRQHATQGQIEVAIQNGYELDELHDVLIVSKSNKDVISYDTAIGLWKNKQLAISDVTGLQTAIDGKQPLTTVLTNTTASFTTAQESKLSGIAAGATANSTDSQLRDRSTHTGTQLSSTISDFNAAADARVVAGITGKENTITAGTTAQYYRGDKTFQTLNKAAVGLSNVDNTSDANKPISTATQSALDAKQPLATVLTNTTASFTTAQQTKLAGVGSVVATVDFGSTFTDSAQIVVTGQSWVSLSSKISAQVLCGTGVDPLEIALLDFKLVVSDLVAGVGFTLTAYSMPQARGTYSIMCVGV